MRWKKKRWSTKAKSRSMIFRVRYAAIMKCVISGKTEERYAIHSAVKIKL